jgi:hypothetical protein
MFWISLLAALGMAFLLVEKDEDWPLTEIVPRIKAFLSLLHPKMPEMLSCTVCTAFWTGLIADVFLLIASGGSYFLWPLTGFAAAGLAWMFYQILDALDGGTEDDSETMAEEGKQSDE